MPNLEQPESKVEAPKALLMYEELWKEAYGKTKPEEMITQLQECARQLLEEDPEFEAYLSRNLLKFVREERIDDKNALGWALVGALSERGKEFGLKVD